MKKSGLFNSHLAAVTAQMGHFDTITVADAGLPIPQHTHRIDLLVKRGQPALLDVVGVLLEELHLEEVIIAEEMAAASPTLHAQLRALLGEIPVRTVPHEEFKRLTASSRAVVRTGEFTPYANIILVSGVRF